MRCQRCGHENEQQANYCSACGALIDGEEENTLALALVEDRQTLDEELGGLLGELPAGMGMLVVRRGPNAGSTYALDAASTSLGRHPDSAVFLDDVTVSRRHAVVRRVGDGYELADAGSLNGTYLDHRRIDVAPMSDMQEIQIGRFVLTFVVGTGPDPGSGPEGLISS
jgi:pSer/pThr/pTyr-binding forkhead associated (FHA) protein